MPCVKAIWQLLLFLPLLPYRTYLPQPPILYCFLHVHHTLGQRIATTLCRIDIICQLTYYSFNSWSDIIACTTVSARSIWKRELFLALHILNLETCTSMGFLAECC